MFRIIITCILLCFSVFVKSQDKTGKIPLSHEYSEILYEHDRGDVNQWLDQPNDLQKSWGSIDFRYDKYSVPRTGKLKSWNTKAWKGEKISAQIILWSKENIDDIKIQFTDLKGKNGVTISSSNISSGFVRYVVTDELNKARTGGCGKRFNKAEWDSSLVADVIDINKSIDLKEQTTQPVWITISIPQTAKEGEYSGSIMISSADNNTQSLDYSIQVLPRVLPLPSDWSFHLDLWQNPFAVARYYEVDLWSDEHFELMEGVMQPLADAGQKVITASVMHKPWNAQTYDYFESMVTWTKKVDGSWNFEYDVFDKWVTFMMDLGISDQINCYSMVPWSLSFRYFDQSTNQMKDLVCKPGDKEYDEVWTAFLKSFAAHLKFKGWFDKTCIAMDERLLPDMKMVIDIIRNADKDFKLSLAGIFYDEIENEIYDYCLSTDQMFPSDVLSKRNKEGKISTYYTYCADTQPNTFTFSHPAEATWTAIYAANLKVDGYLRWAYNSWTKQPLLDTRFDTWAAGDTYLVYPGFRTSIRFERLIEGIQFYEKIKILEAEFKKKGQRRNLQKLEKTLGLFEIAYLKKSNSASEPVNKLKAFVNSF